jgi:hypothetical protein
MRPWRYLTTGLSSSRSVGGRVASGTRSCAARLRRHIRSREAVSAKMYSASVELWATSLRRDEDQWTGRPLAEQRMPLTDLHLSGSFAVRPGVKAERATSAICDASVAASAQVAETMFGDLVVASGGLVDVSAELRRYTWDTECVESAIRRKEAE